MATEQAVHLLLDYVATYPADGIVYRSSDMILCAHADAGFLNDTNSCSRAGAHIFLSENDPFPCFNGAVLSISQIIKFVMTSAAESELAALFVTTREMIPHRQTLIAMGWPQPKSPIQTNDSTAADVTNKTIVPRRVKMMDMRLWWLQCHGSQNLAEKVADMLATCHPDSQMSSLLAEMPPSRRHNFDPDTFFVSGFADIHQIFLFSTIGTYVEFLCKF